MVATDCIEKTGEQGQSVSVLMRCKYLISIYLSKTLWRRKMRKKERKKKKEKNKERKKEERMRKGSPRENYT